MRPKVEALSVRSSLTCRDTSSLWVMSSPASNRACDKQTFDYDSAPLNKNLWYVCLLFLSLPDTHHYSLQDLCGDGWEHPLVIVLTDTGEDAWQLGRHRPEKDTQCDVYILQICGAGGSTVTHSATWANSKTIHRHTCGQKMDRVRSLLMYLYCLWSQARCVDGSGNQRWLVSEPREWGSGFLHRQRRPALLWTCQRSQPGALRPLWRETSVLFCLPKGFQFIAWKCFIVDCVEYIFALYLS